MSVRTVELVRGIETVLFLKKSGTFVLVGCATDINYSGDRELLTANCYSGKEVLPSGDDPAYTFSINGLVKQYNEDNIDDNVSAGDLEDLFISGDIAEFKYARPHVGDRVRTFFGFVTAFGEAGTTNGIQTYTATITPKDLPTISVVAA